MKLLWSILLFIYLISIFCPDIRFSFLKLTFTLIKLKIHSIINLTFFCGVTISIPAFLNVAIIGDSLLSSDIRFSFLKLTFTLIKLNIHSIINLTFLGCNNFYSRISKHPLGFLILSRYQIQFPQIHSHSHQTKHSFHHKTGIYWCVTIYIPAFLNVALWVPYAFQITDSVSSNSIILSSN